jgi:hypothetical protein
VELADEGAAGQARPAGQLVDGERLVERAGPLRPGRVVDVLGLAASSMRRRDQCPRALTRPATASPASWCESAARTGTPTTLEQAALTSRWGE